MSQKLQNLANPTYNNFFHSRQIISFVIPTEGRTEGMIETIIRGGEYVDPKTQKQYFADPSNPLLLIRKYQWGKPTKTVVPYYMDVVQKHLEKRTSEAPQASTGA